MNKTTKQAVSGCTAAWLVAFGAVQWAGAQGGVIQHSALLPPQTGMYHGSFTSYPQGVILEDIEVFDFSNISRETVGPDEEHMFSAMMTAHVTYQGLPLGYHSLSGRMTVLVRNYISGQVGTFDTEILSMNFAGMVDVFPVAVQESPSMNSMGQIMITELGLRSFQVDSFFDVWTELQVGDTGFLPQEGDATRMTLVSENEPLSLDIKPGSCPNPINPKSKGKLPVALLGTDTFDVSMVDLTTLALARADGVGGMAMPLEGPPGPRSVIADVGTPFEGEVCECHEEQGDGIDDLSMKFSTQEVVIALELDTLEAGEAVELVLTGTLHDGNTFEARDCVVRVPVGDVNVDGRTNLIDLSYVKHKAGADPHQGDNAVFDFNGDGQVDSIDVAMVKSHMGGTVETP